MHLPRMVCHLIGRLPRHTAAAASAATATLRPVPSAAAADADAAAAARRLCDRPAAGWQEAPHVGV